MNGMKTCALVALVLVGACGKKDQEAPAPAPSNAASSTASNAASSETSGKAAAPKSATLMVAGTYDAKRGEIRMPGDAPPFLHPEVKDGIGTGELSMELPASSGTITGKLDGALGTLAFSGFLDETGTVRGTLAPATGSALSMWGTVDAKAEGQGDGRTVTGSLRVSDADGRVVREATFKLEKKK
jgi:hypothetical protein